MRGRGDLDYIIGRHFYSAPIITRRCRGIFPSRPSQSGAPHRLALASSVAECAFIGLVNRGRLQGKGLLFSLYSAAIARVSNRAHERHG